MPDNRDSVDELRSARNLAEAELGGRIPDPIVDVISIATRRPLHEYGLGPDPDYLRRQAEELEEHISDLAGHLREQRAALCNIEGVLDRARDLILNIREGLQ